MVIKTIYVGQDATSQNKTVISREGNIYTKITKNVPTSEVYLVKAIEYNKSVFISGDNGNFISYDGLNFKKLDLGAIVSVRELSEVNGKLFAIGVDINNTRAIAYGTLEKNGWETVTIHEHNAFVPFKIYSNELFTVAIAEDYKISYCLNSNPTNFYVSATPLNADPPDLYDVIYQEDYNRWYIVGSKGYTFYHNNEIMNDEWEAEASVVGSVLIRRSFSQNKNFLVVANNNDNTENNYRDKIMEGWLATTHADTIPTGGFNYTSYIESNNTFYTINYGNESSIIFSSEDNGNNWKDVTDDPLENPFLNYSNNIYAITDATFIDNTAEPNYITTYIITGVIIFLLLVLIIYANIKK